MRPTLTAEMSRVTTADRIAAAEQFRRSNEAKESSAAPRTAHMRGSEPAQRPRRFGARALARRLARTYS
jgi:hypothetical protein